MYCTWKLKELKDELKKRGTRITRKKADLVERLEAYDRNFNFGNQSPQASKSQDIDVPAVELYQDVNSSTILPKITKQHIQSCFDRFNKNISDAVRLYESRYLLVLRSTTSCQYIPKRLLQVIREKIILLHEVSTSHLQTFHKPSKKYYATPLRASRLPSKRDVHNTVYSPYLKQNPRFDKNAFNCRFQSLILNYPHSSMPLKQLYPAANQQAICLDHEYTEKQAVDVFLESINVLNVSETRIMEIERETRGQSSNSKWHEYRKTRIFLTVCHLKSETLIKYCKQILNKNVIQTRAMAHGIINEKVAIKKYEEAYDLIVVECGLFLSQERPYLGASPDGLLGSETIIEIKCPYASRNQKSVLLQYHIFNMMKMNIGF